MVQHTTRAAARIVVVAAVALPGVAFILRGSVGGGQGLGRVSSGVGVSTGPPLPIAKLSRGIGGWGAGD